MSVEELLEFVPEDKRPAFIEKAKAVNVEKITDEVIYTRAMASQSLRDKISDPQVQARFKNFEETKLAEVLEKARKEERDKVLKEMNKEPTEEQKRIRELEEKIAKGEAKEIAETKKAALRKKATELGYDPLKAERLYALEDAEALLAVLAEDNKKSAEELDKLKKQMTFGSPAPRGGQSSNTPRLDALRKEYVTLQNAGRGTEAMAVFLRMQEEENKNGQ